MEGILGTATPANTVSVSGWERRGLDGRGKAGARPRRRQPRLLLLHGTVSSRGIKRTDQAPTKTGRPGPRHVDPCFKARAAYQTPEPASSSVKEGCGANKRAYEQSVPDKWHVVLLLLLLLLLPGAFPGICYYQEPDLLSPRGSERKEGRELKSQERRNEGKEELKADGRIQKEEQWPLTMPLGIWAAVSPQTRSVYFCDTRHLLAGQ